MPRTSSTTKDRLLAAGEHHFAHDGITGALTRDIVASAGQANDSAIHYHFGSRTGLLAAIIDKHVQRMEDERRETLGRMGSNPRLHTLVQAIVGPVADELRSEDGRNFLLIIAQLAGQAQADAAAAPPLRGTALSQQLRMLELDCRESLPPRLAAERIGMMITMLTATLAERSRRLAENRRPALGHEAYVSNLVAVLTAALRAPVPVGRR